MAQFKTQCYDIFFTLHVADLHLLENNLQPYSNIYIVSQDNFPYLLDLDYFIYFITFLGEIQ